MKTPQEQAKEMIFDLQLNSWSKAHILESIPLPELIAVAQAATKIGGERIEFEGSEHYAVVIEEVDELDNTLEALRATGKVEL